MLHCKLIGIGWGCHSKVEDLPRMHKAIASIRNRGGQRGGGGEREEWGGRGREGERKVFSRGIFGWGERPQNCR